MRYKNTTNETKTITYTSKDPDGNDKTETRDVPVGTIFGFDDTENNGQEIIDSLDTQNVEPA